ncbi:MAG TPA: 16S rRNA (cytidine(1402)-2'-O)-methyltransferase [Actinomycetota bacterium]|nr:16S rRNA (cytidine(1402)-2'-O)-methyltransferase [Actinomycetota bacterium]
MSGRLFVVATPIGNLADITLRALRVLGEADVIAAEDTRTTRKLLAHHGIRTPLVSYHEHNEVVRTPELLKRMESGETVALVSEAGTPSISDPGYRLVSEAIAAGVAVEPVPGASAILAAVVVSGLPSDSFVFEGFLPRRRTERQRRLESLKNEARTLVFFEAPHRLDHSLTDLLEVLGDRRVALCRELTKLHEEVRRGTLTELVAALQRRPVKGEIVLVVEGAKEAAVDLDGAIDEALDRIGKGASLREAARDVADERGVPRRALYDRVLQRRKERE